MLIEIIHLPLSRQFSSLTAMNSAFSFAMNLRQKPKCAQCKRQRSLMFMQTQVTAEGVWRRIEMLIELVARGVCRSGGLVIVLQ